MHKIALQLGPLTISWYGILVASGFGAGVWTACRRARTANIAEEQIIALCNWLILGAIVGSRLWYVLANWSEYFSHHPFSEVFVIWHGGLVFYGGLVGATLAGFLYVIRQRLSFWRFADVLAPSLALGQFFGRLGCLMNGCCYGKPTHCPWAIHFPPSYDNGGLVNHPSGGGGVHPTEIYEAVLNLALSFTLAWLFRRRRFDGQVFAGYLVAYGILRAFVEIFRGDYDTYYLGFLTPAQIFSAVIVPVGLLCLWRLPRRLAGERPAG